MQSFQGEQGGPDTGAQPGWNEQQQWQSEGSSYQENSGDQSNGPQQNESHQVYQHLRRAEIPENIIQRLKEIFAQNIMTEDELDVRAIEGLSEFSPDAALDILQQLADSNLDTVTNKSAYLCGVMRSYRAKVRTAEEMGVENVIPNPEKIKQLIERTKYRLTVTPGQRKYGGPPPGWEGERGPGDGCEVRNG